MKVRYIGMFPEVLVPALGRVVKRGEPVEAPEAVALGLLAQGAEFKGGVQQGPGTEWEEAKAGKAEKARPADAEPVSPVLPSGEAE